jgi:hypothetical protein
MAVAAFLAAGALESVRAGGAGAATGNASAVFVLRADVTSTGAQSVGPSNFPTVSADGRYIGFMSAAQDLVPGVTNGTYNSYIHDALTGATSDVAVASDGTPGNGPSYTPRVSADGRYSVFASSATNLVPIDTGGTQNVFLHDSQTGATTLVSMSSTGGAPNGASTVDDLSSDGTFVLFDSMATNIVSGVAPPSTEAYLFDRLTGATTLVSQTVGGTPADGSNIGGGVSDNGQYVAFTSTSPTLAGGAGLAGVSQVYLRDLVTGTTTLVSVSLPGGPGNGASAWPSISSTGQFVVFQSDASNLVPNDTNGVTDVFERNMSAGVTVRVSVSSSNGQANGQSLIYMPQHRAVSANGCRVVFYSSASNLVPHDTNHATDVFLHDCQTNRTTLVSTDAYGLQGWFPSAHAAISADGNYVVFASRSMNLVPNDTNVATDIFEVFLNRDAIASVTSPELAPGSNGNVVTITGVGFQRSALVTLGPGLSVASRTVVSPAEIQVTVDVQVGAPQGSSTVDVVNPGTGPGAAAGAVAQDPGALTVG